MKTKIYIIVYISVLIAVIVFSWYLYNYLQLTRAYETLLEDAPTEFINFDYYDNGYIKGNKGIHYIVYKKKYLIHPGSDYKNGTISGGLVLEDLNKMSISQKVRRLEIFQRVKGQELGYYDNYVQDLVYNYENYGKNFIQTIFPKIVNTWHFSDFVNKFNVYDFKVISYHNSPNVEYNHVLCMYLESSKKLLRIFVSFSYPIMLTKERIKEMEPQLSISLLDDGKYIMTF